MSKLNMTILTALSIVAVLTVLVMSIIEVERKGKVCKRVDMKFDGLNYCVTRDGTKIPFDAIDNKKPIHKWNK